MKLDVIKILEDTLPEAKQIHRYTENKETYYSALELFEVLGYKAPKQSASKAFSEVRQRILKANPRLTYCNDLHVTQKDIFEAMMRLTKNNENALLFRKELMKKLWEVLEVEK